MVISIDAQLFQARRMGLVNAARNLSASEPEKTPASSGVPELSAIDSALSNLHSNVTHVRDSFIEMLHDSSESLQGVHDDFKAVEEIQLKRISKIVAELP